MNSNKMKSSYAFEVSFAFDYKRKRFNSHKENDFFHLKKKSIPRFNVLANCQHTNYGKEKINEIFLTFIRIRILNQNYVFTLHYA